MCSCCCWYIFLFFYLSSSLLVLLSKILYHGTSDGIRSGTNQSILKYWVAYIHRIEYYQSNCYLVDIYIAVVIVIIFVTPALFPSFIVRYHGPRQRNHHPFRLHLNYLPSANYDFNLRHYISPWSFSFILEVYNISTNDNVIFLLSIFIVFRLSSLHQSWLPPSLLHIPHLPYWFLPYFTSKPFLYLGSI